VSGFEILTITFSFIIGLGVAQVLQAVAHVLRERGQMRLHWIPFSVAAMVLFFQIQFWFALVVVNSLMDEWSWPVYSLMLLLAILVFLGGATVLPPLTPLAQRSLLEDFDTRGKLSLVFLALYLAGWIVVGVVFWIPQLWHLALVNGLMAIMLLFAYQATNRRARTALHLALLAVTFYGALTVWTPPSLQAPF
jgi:hypothetical protein